MRKLRRGLERVIGQQAAGRVTIALGCVLAVAVLEAWRWAMVSLAPTLHALSARNFGFPVLAVAVALVVWVTPQR